MCIHPYCYIHTWNYSLIEVCTCYSWKHYTGLLPNWHANCEVAKATLIFYYKLLLSKTWIIRNCLLISSFSTEGYLGAHMKVEHAAGVNLGNHKRPCISPPYHGIQALPSKDITHCIFFFKGKKQWCQAITKCHLLNSTANFPLETTECFSGTKKDPAEHSSGNTCVRLPRTQPTKRKAAEGQQLAEPLLNALLLILRCIFSKHILS